MPKPDPVFDDAIDAKLRREREGAERREAARLKFRENFPKTANFADHCRSLFGDDVEILWAIEANQFVGNVPAEEVRAYEKKFGAAHRLRLKKEK